MTAYTFCGRCSHPMHWHECYGGANTTAGPCPCRNDVPELGQANPALMGTEYGTLLESRRDWWPYVLGLGGWIVALVVWLAR